MDHKLKKVALAKANKLRTATYPVVQVVKSKNSFNGNSFELDLAFLIGLVGQSDDF